LSLLILLGAGFSRNWGGWLASEAFEYLLGCREVVRDAHLRDLLWKHHLAGGFEDVLEELQIAYARDPQGNEKALFAFQAATSRMFDDMNRAFIDRTEWEFQNDQSHMVRTFLMKFEGIFSLNQDVLLERHYCNDNILLGSTGRWSGAQLPGLKRTPSPEPLNSNCWARSTWVSKPALEFKVDSGFQPIFKLHGSSNWKNAEGKPLLVMGGAKVGEIGRNPILSWYSQLFEQYLMAPNARLMVIGYGFRDPHINAAIGRAVDRGLRMFVIAPEGPEIAIRLNPTRRPGQIVSPTELEGTLKQTLIGASRRPLSDIFGNDIAEFNKVMRFFES
jgi:SIR2-like domain